MTDTDGLRPGNQETTCIAAGSAGIAHFVQCDVRNVMEVRKRLNLSADKPCSETENGSQFMTYFT